MTTALLRSIPFLLLLAAARPAAGEIIDRIAVSVGNRVITASDLEREIRVAAFFNEVAPDFSVASRRAAAEELVKQTLMRRELETSLYVPPGPSEGETLLAELRKKSFPNDAEYRAALSAAGITEQDLKDALLWQRTFLLFVDQRFGPGVQVSDQEIQQYFEQVVAPAARTASPGKAVALEDYRDDVEKTLTGRRVDQETERWLEEVRARTEIVFHSEVFQ